MSERDGSLETARSLIGSLLDGRIDSDRFAELQTLMRHDPAARRMYVDAVELHGNLHWEHAMASAEADGVAWDPLLADLARADSVDTGVENDPAQRAPRAHRPIASRASGDRGLPTAFRMVAAALVALTLIGFLLPEPTPDGASIEPVDENPRVAQQSESAPRDFEATGSVSGALTARPRPEPMAMSALAVGATISTDAHERTRVRLPDGSIAYVDNETTLRVDGPRSVSLRSGSAYFEVSPRKGGDRFVVKTPDRTVDAIGTKFAVDVAPAGTEVLVTQGKVRVAGIRGVLTAGSRLVALAGRGAVVEAGPRASSLLDWTRELRGDARLVPASEHLGGSLVTSDARRLELRRYHVDVHIEDGFARTTIDQTYFNHSPARLEGTFHFPLPPDASISRLAMYVNGKLMEGGMVERNRGRDIFETIRYRRRDPALLEWVDGSTFKMRVFPIEGRQEKRIILSYAQRLSSAYGRATYRFPAGHDLGRMSRWSVEARLHGAAGRDWGCDSHSLKARVDGADLVLTSKQDDARPDRDLVLKIAEPESAGATRFSKFDQEGARYLMVRHRPDLPGRAVAKRTDWIFLCETSADRNPLLARTQIEIVRTLLDNCDASDRFVVLTAGARTRACSETLLANEPANAQRAIAFLEAAQIIGALDLEKAFAATEPYVRAATNPCVVHLGSGIAVLGEREQSKLVERLSGEAPYVGVGVGKRWARGLMKQAASRTGGYVTGINPDENVPWRAFELLSTLRSPRLLDVEVVDASGRWTFLPCDDVLAHGQELCAIARRGVWVVDEAKLPTRIEVRGRIDGKPFREKLDVPKKMGQAGHLPRTWAKLEIDRLLAEGAGANRERIIALSKAMYVMSPFTSLLVLENDAMYKQFAVDRGRKDHWALYPCPASIPVVAEPTPTVSRPTNAFEPARRAKRPPSPLLVLRDYLVRLPTAPWESPAHGGPHGGPVISAWRLIGDGSRNDHTGDDAVHAIESLRDSVAFDGNMDGFTGITTGRRALNSKRLSDATPPSFDLTASVPWNDSGLGVEIAWDRAPAPRSTSANGSETREFRIPMAQSSFDGNEPLLQAKSLQRIEAQRLRRTVIDALEFANKRVRSSPDEAIESLERSLMTVSESPLSPDLTMPIRRQLERRIRRYRTDLRRFDGDRIKTDRLVSRHGSVSRSPREVEASRRADVKELMRRYRILMNANNYREAEAIAHQITEVDPDEVIGSAALWKAQLARHYTSANSLALRKQAGWTEQMMAIEESGIPQSNFEPITYPDATIWEELTVKRRKYKAVDLTVDSEGTQEVREALKRPVSFEFQDTPLDDVIEFLRQSTKLKMVLDPIGLADASVDADTPVTLTLHDVALESALRLTLEPLDLSFLIRDDALVITDRENVEDDGLVTRIYPIGELVTSGFETDNARVRPWTNRIVHWIGDEEGTGVEDLIRGVREAIDNVDSPGAVEYLRPGQCLVVTATEAGQRGVQDLLAHWFGLRRIDGLSKPVVPRQGSNDRNPFVYRRPETVNAESLSRDLIAYAPGMNTMRVDLLAVLDAANDGATKRVRGRVDDAARALIDAARGAGWRAATVTIDGAEARIAFDGTGRYAYERTLPAGLRERVVCDGSSLWHSYPELGIGAQRSVGPVHRADFARLVPWALPPVEDWTRTCDVLCPEARTVALVPIGADEAVDVDGKPARHPRVELVFSPTGPLVERRVIDMPSKKLVYRTTFTDDGHVRLIDAEGVVRREQAYDVAPVGAADLAPDRDHLVFVPLPILTREALDRMAGRKEPGPTAELSEDDALAVAMANLGHDSQRVWKVLRERFFQRDDRRLGFYTLLLSASVTRNAKGQVTIDKSLAVRPDLLEKYPDSALVHYVNGVLRADAEDSRGSIKLPDDEAPGLLHRLVTFRAKHAEWAARRGEWSRKEFAEAIAYLRGCESPVLGWALLPYVLSHAPTEPNAKVDPGSTLLAWLLGRPLIESDADLDVADAFGAFEEVPGLEYAARYERARWLARKGSRGEAAKLFRALFLETLAAGGLPAFDRYLFDAVASDLEREAVGSDPVASEEEEGRGALMRRAFETLATSGRWRDIEALAWRCHRLGDPGLAERLFTEAIERAPEGERFGSRLAFVEYLSRTGKTARADAALRPLLENGPARFAPSMWRLAATFSRRRGRDAEWLQRVDRALEIEYRASDEPIDLEALRGENQALLSGYRELAESIATLSAESTRELVTRVVRAADRWRALDSDASGACRRASRVLVALGERELAWDYLTSPLATSAEPATAWLQAARELRKQGDATLADRAYSAAFEAEATNAEVLWEWAEYLRGLGRTQASDALLRRLATGTWQPRFESLIHRTRRRLGTRD